MSELEQEPSENDRQNNFWDELNFFDSLYDASDEEDAAAASSDSERLMGLLPLSSDDLLRRQEHVDRPAEWSVSTKEKPRGVAEGVTSSESSSALGVLSEKDEQGASAVAKRPDKSKSRSKSVKVTGSSAKVGGKVESKEALLLKRKKAVISAKATREKKKRLMAELRKSNFELMKERRMFRKIIADLQLQVQANREAGEIDLATENELLRAELQEHKSFIAQFKRVADGTPVSKTEKKVALLKGAKAAIGQILGLLHTSMVDKSWKRGYSRLHPELLVHYQRLPLGCSSRMASRINFRVDVPPVLAPMDAFYKIQWKIWSDSELSHRLSSHFGQLREKEIKEIALDLEDLDVDQDPDFKVKVYYYREKRLRTKQEIEEEGSNARHTKTLDTIFLTTSKKQDLPYNGMPAAEGIDSNMPQSNEDPKMYPTIVMATTSTQHAQDIVSAKPGVHRIESALLEGVVIRQLENGMVSCTSLNSYPLNPIGAESTSDFLSASNSEGFIDDDGYFTNVADQAGNDQMRIFAECLGPETAKAYLHEAIQVAKALQEKDSKDATTAK